MEKQQSQRFEYIGAYSIPDGYSGKRSISYVNFDPESGFIIHVHRFGLYPCPFFPMRFKDAEEAKSYIETHPKGRHYFK